MITGSSYRRVYISLVPEMLRVCDICLKYNLALAGRISHWPPGRAPACSVRVVQFGNVCTVYCTVYCSCIVSSVSSVCAVSCWLGSAIPVRQMFPGLLRRQHVISDLHRLLGAAGISPWSCLLYTSPSPRD